MCLCQIQRATFVFDFSQEEKRSFNWKTTMSGDPKRIPAPESVPYHVNARIKTKTYEDKLATTLVNGKRLDGRAFSEARKICKFSIRRCRCGDRFTYDLYMAFSLFQFSN